MRAWILAPTLALACGSGEPTRVAHAPVTVHIPRPRASVAPAPPKAEPPSEPPDARRATDGGSEQEELDQAQRTSELLTKARPRLSHCFLSHVADTRKRRVTVHFVLWRNGSISGVRTEPGWDSTPLTRCLTRVLEGVPFEPARAEATRLQVSLRLDAP